MTAPIIAQWRADPRFIRAAVDAITAHLGDAADSALVTCTTPMVATPPAARRAGAPREVDRPAAMEAAK